MFLDISPWKSPFLKAIIANKEKQKKINEGKRVIDDGEKVIDKVK